MIEVVDHIAEIKVVQVCGTADPAVNSTGLNCSVRIRICDRGCAEAEASGRQSVRIQAGNADQGILVRIRKIRILDGLGCTDAIESFAENAEGMDTELLGCFINALEENTVTIISFAQFLLAGAQEGEHRRGQLRIVILGSGNVAHLNGAHHQFLNGR